MKQLVLIRHGKAERDLPVVSDHERPLLQKGVKRTLAIADFLKEQGILPQLILSSHAVRAHDTARLIAGRLFQTPRPVRVEENIYYRGRDALYDLVTALPDELDAVIMVGHNPHITHFANMFLNNPVNYMPTSAAAGFSFEAGRWCDILLGGRQTLFFVTPRDLTT